MHFLFAAVFIRVCIVVYILLRPRTYLFNSLYICDVCGHRLFIYCLFSLSLSFGHLFRQVRASAVPN